MGNKKNHVNVSKVGIIGAGISGIAAAKQLAHYRPVVFEATDSIGGVWKHCSFSSTKLQTPRCDYEFSDYPWPDRDNSTFPSHFEILDYLHGYATHFDVLKYVKFNSKVVEVGYLGDPAETLPLPPRDYGNLLRGHSVWEVAVQTHQPDTTVQWYAFEFLVVCIGKYGDIPRLPIFPPNKGQEMFGGKVLHSIDYSKLDKEAARQLVKGKKVAVIGYKKSAIDLAVESAEANQGVDGQPCTMVIRTLHWTVPSYWIWTVYPRKARPKFVQGSIMPTFVSSVQFKRIRTLLMHICMASCWLHVLIQLLLMMEYYCMQRRAISKFIETYLVWKLPLVKYGLKPDHPFEEDYASCQMAILPENFFVEAEKGRILFKRASQWWFWSRGIEFEDNTRLEADVVLLATGYDGSKKLKALLPEPFCSLIQESNSGIMPLYRGTIHPLIPNIAFVGYIESVSNLHSAELRCKWLARLADGHFKLPTIHKMLQQTTKEIEVMKRTTRFYKRHCISTFSINHSDEICEEMGWKSWRKKNWLLEAFSPYNSQDYQEDK